MMEMTSEMQEILQDLETGLNDWLVTYTDDMQREPDVLDSQARIFEAGGTIAYVSNLQGKLETLKSLLGAA